MDMPIELSVIIPTYNEKSNISVILDRIVQTLEGKVTFEILVVDDDSPDQTWAAVKKVGETDPRIRLLRRIGRRGLSSAVVEGFSAARGSTLAVIDADLQHDERILPEMYAASKEANLVVGSRKAEGGKIENWNILRRWVSNIATLLAKIFLVTPLKDPMSGFFLLKRETFTRIESEINPRGFKILLEILFRSKEKKIKEIGYTFRPRVAGVSKLSTSTIFDFLYSLLELRFGHWISLRFLKYAAVGASGVGVNLLTLWVLHEKLQMGASFSLSIAIFLSMLSNFFLNNQFTFRDYALHSQALWIGFFRFLLVCSVGALINYALTQFWVNHGGNLYLADAVGISVATVWNYVVNQHVTWNSGS